MRRSRPSLLIAGVLALGLVAGGTTVAVAASSGSTVKVCTTKKGVVRSASSSGKCPSKTKQKAISVTGPAGAAGAQGVAGAPGAPGAKGATGSQGIQGVAGTAGPTSTDFYREISGDPGLVSLANVEGVQLTLNCNTNGATIWGFPPEGVKVRFGGTYALGSAAPTSAVGINQVALPFVFSPTTIWVSYVVTNMTTKKSFRLDATGSRSGVDCVFSGQITQ